MKRTFVAIMLTSAAVLLPAFAQAEVGVNIVIGNAPPPPRYEVVPGPRNGYVWIPGYWDWNGYQHVWNPGYWERTRSGYFYEAPRWYQGPSGWVLERGGWHSGDRRAWEYRHRVDNYEWRHDHRPDYRPDHRPGPGPRPGPGYGHGHGNGDRDRDGVPNRYDRDRDGDGVPNRQDHRPDNPRRN